MAVSTTLEKIASSNDLKKYSLFKEDFVKKLDWRYKDWQINGQVNSTMHTLIKKCKFWFGNLKEVSHEKFLVLTLFSEGLETLISPRQILSSFKRQLGLSGLKGFSITRNSSFLVLYFESVEQRRAAADNFCLVENAIVINSDWLITKDSFEFRMIWLPPIIDLCEVHEKLSEYVEVEEIQNESCELDDSDILPSGMFSGKFKLIESVKITQVPHIFEINGYEALLIVPKRQALCLNCFKIGHISARCPTPFCSNCQCKMPREHKCNSRNNMPSYADILGISNKAPIEEGYGGIIVNKAKPRQDEGGSKIVKFLEQHTKEIKEFEQFIESSNLEEKGSVSGTPNVVEKMDTQYTASKRSFDQLLAVDQRSEHLEVNTQGKLDYSKKSVMQLRSKSKEGKEVNATDE